MPWTGSALTPDQNQTHLQQKLDLGLDHILITVVKQLRTVTALQDKRLSQSNILQMLPEAMDLLRGHQRRQFLELVEGSLHAARVAVDDILLDGFGFPG